MKVYRLFLPLLIAYLSACKEQHTAIPVITSPDYEKGQSFLNQQSDSAFYYFNKVATSSKDSLQTAMAYNKMALIQADGGDYYGSQETLLTSLKYLNEQKENDSYCLASDYNQLGRNSSDLKNYVAAIGYYDQTLKFSKNEGFTAIILNNKAVAYQKMGQYAQAIGIYRSIIDSSKKNKKEYARILSNLAKVRWLQDPDYRAAPDLLTALQLRKDGKDEWGLNASYAHLSDYYSLSRPDSALIYAGKMYAIAQELNSPDDEMEALQKLIRLSPARELKQYFMRYQFLADSVQTLRNASKNQFALIRYDAEKNKSDNLRLQKDNTDKKVQILRQRTIIFVIVVVVVLLVAWYRKRTREHQLKTSQKIHDVVANGLYSVMMDIKYRDTLDKDQLLDKIDLLYEQSRDISYERPGSIRTDFQEVVADLLTSFANPDTKILIVGNNKELWSKINDHIKIELEYVLKELMINMKKHSSAQNVVVRFEREGEHLKIRYTDDGIGLPPAFRYGNGLANTENRIERIGGKIIFDKSAPKGLKIQIYLPIA